MDPQSFLSSAVLLLLATSIAVTLFRQYGLGSILGLLVAGIFIGPYSPGPIVTRHVEELRQFTELGVVLLLFLVGLEMQPQRLWSMRREMFGLGTLQIIVSGLAIALYGLLSMNSWSAALFSGLALSLSSTAFAMQILQERGEIASRHGQTSFAVLLMQDLAIVPLLALIPVLAGGPNRVAEEPIWQQLLLILGMLGAVYVLGRYLVPLVLEWLGRQRNRDGFLLVTLAAVFTASFAMEQAGLSQALGAFLMGMLLSTSRYHYQIQATVEPHKGLLISLFFVAVGMSIDLNALAERPLQFFTDVAVVLTIKIAVLFGLCLLFGLGRATAVRVAFLLSQSGEFGFVLFGAAKGLALIDDATFVSAVAVISLSMLLTPLLVKLGDHAAGRMQDGGARLDRGLCYPGEGTLPEARVVIAGYGRIGHSVGVILQTSGIPYIAFEADPKRVASWRAEGHPVYYGDIGDPHLLVAVGMERLDLVILTIDHWQTAVRAARLIRDLSQEVQIIARARDLSVCDEMTRAGVNRAIPELLEASLRLAAEAMEMIGTEADSTDKMARDVRSSDYAPLRDGGEDTPHSREH